MEENQLGSQARWIAVSLFSLFSFLSIYSLNSIFHHGEHTFQRLEDWHNLKSMGRSSLMGVYEFISQRQSLARDQLNLGEWHGHNHVIWDQPGPWNKVSLDAKLDSEAHLWIFLSESRSQKYGFRISRSQRFSSGFFRLGPSGEIRERNTFPIEVHQNWNHIEIEFNDDSTLLRVNGREISSVPQAFKGRTILSFRNGIHAVSIDNLLAQKGQVNLRQDFSPQFQSRYFAVVILFYLSILVLILLMSLWLRNFKEKLFMVLTYQFFATLLFTACDWLDRHKLSESYFYQDYYIPFDRVRKDTTISEFEQKRAQFFKLLQTYAGKKVPHLNREPSDHVISIFGFAKNADYKKPGTFQLIEPTGASTLITDVSTLPEVPSRDLKVITMGTSQTWGAGSASVHSSFVAQMILGLNQRLKRRVYGFDQSVCGARIPRLFEIYQKVLMHWKPDVLVVNLSNNDGVNHLHFLEYLNKIAETNREKKIRTFFVLEANDMQGVRYIQYQHRIMEAVAKDHQIPILDLNGFLDSPEIRDAGTLWFDIVHLDQAGHDLVAKWLVEQLTPYLKRQ